MIVVRWTNDETDEAPTWQALLDHVRATQWQPYETEREFREQMAWRALNWSGTTIGADGTPAQFFAELERAEIIVIEQADEEDGLAI